jgi:hypothetical protein
MRKLKQMFRNVFTINVRPSLVLFSKQPSGRRQPKSTPKWVDNYERIM